MIRVVGMKKKALAVITIAIAIGEWFFGSLVFENSIITSYKYSIFLIFFQFSFKIGLFCLAI